MKTPEDCKGRGLTAPGCPANDSGTKLKRGAAVQVMTYPRPKSKSVLVEASRKAERSLSSFMVLASLREAAAILGSEITDLIPPEELDQYNKIAQQGPLLGTAESVDKSAPFDEAALSQFVVDVTRKLSENSPPETVKKPMARSGGPVDPKRSAAAKRAWLTIRARRDGARLDKSEPSAGV